MNVFLQAHFFILIFIVSPLIHAQSEPITLSYVMRNIGKKLIPADKALREGASNPAYVTAENYGAAIQSIEDTINLVNLGIPDMTLEDGKPTTCAMALLPTGVAKYELEPLLYYADRYNAYMEKLVRELTIYQELFVVQRELEEAQRNFSELSAQRDKIKELIPEAHAHEGVGPPY